MLLFSEDEMKQALHGLMHARMRQYVAETGKSIPREYIEGMWNQLCHQLTFLDHAKMELEFLAREQQWRIDVTFRSPIRVEEQDDEVATVECVTCGAVNLDGTHRCASCAANL